MHDKTLRIEVRELRSQGKTYSEIEKTLGIIVPKSTLSDWCNNVELPGWYEQKVMELNRKSLSKAQKYSLVSNKIKREKFFEKIIKSNQQVVKRISNKDALRTVLSILYLGEGEKCKSHRRLMLGSSDEKIVKLYIQLLRICYGINPRSLKCRISYRADQNIQALQRYWSRVTSIPRGNFYKTKPDPRTVGKPTKRKDYKGVCVVTYGRTDIQLELETIPKLILETIEGL